ncbi:MAG: CvpA family protein [Clostridia bacterium]|nr:CvpA family protein [Clostridia bacterium]
MNVLDIFAFGLIIVIALINMLAGFQKFCLNNICTIAMIASIVLLAPVLAGIINGALIGPLGGLVESLNNTGASVADKITFSEGLQSIVANLGNTVLNVISYIIVIISLLIVLAIVFAIIKKVVRFINVKKGVMKLVDKLLGLVFGAVIWGVIISALVVLVGKIPVEGIQTLVGESFIYKTVSSIIPL